MVQTEWGQMCLPMPLVVWSVAAMLSKVCSWSLRCTCHLNSLPFTPCASLRTSTANESRRMGCVIIIICNHQQQHTTNALITFVSFASTAFDAPCAPSAQLHHEGKQARGCAIFGLLTAETKAQHCKATASFMPICKHLIPCLASFTYPSYRLSAQWRSALADSCSCPAGLRTDHPPLTTHQK